MIVTITSIVSGAAGLPAYFEIAVVLTLIAVLVVKEFVSTGGKRGQSLGRKLRVIIFPLIFVFFVVVSMKIWEALSKIGDSG